MRPLVREAVDAESAQWDAFVRAHSTSTACHLWGWRSIMGGVLGHDCRYLVALDPDGSWRGILPLVRVHGFAGHYLISLPFVNDGGPLGDDAACAALAEHAVAEAKSARVGVLELRTRHALSDRGPLATSNRKIAVHLELPATVEQLWATTFRAKLRSQIRRPGKEGMTVRFGSGEVPSFYSVFARNMRDLGTPVLPRRFFQQLPAALGDHVLFATVYSASGVPVAAACSLIWQDEIEVTWASSLREYNASSPNMLLYASLMEHAVARGIRRFNFGRCTPGGSTHRFKLQWGGQDVPLPWGFWSRNGEVGPPSADSRAYRFAIAAWQRLPMAIANRAGPFLARQLP